MAWRFCTNFQGEFAADCTPPTARGVAFGMASFVPGAGVSFHFLIEGLKRLEKYRFA
jgi:hypothetical protein